MAIILEILERMREKELLYILEKRDISSERKEELEKELFQVKETISKKMGQALYDYYVKNNMLQSANTLIHEGRATPRSFEEVQKMEENIVITNTTETVATTGWPKEVKLVKERVALIEAELYEAAKNICKGDPKVLVSALGKILTKARTEKKPE